MIDISLEHRGQPCENMRAAISSKDGIFTARLSTAKTLLPGYYVVVAQVSQWRQSGELAKYLEKIGEIRVTQAITVGTAEEIKKCRDDQLKVYDEQLAEMEATFARLSEVYRRLMKMGGTQGVAEEWNRATGDVRQECMLKAQALNDRFADAVIPIFPLIHTWAINGWMNLIKIHETLGTGLTIEAEGLAQHGETHAVFLNESDEEFKGYVRGMRAQMLLERHLEVRDKLLNVLTLFSGLFDESRNTFHQVKGIDSSEMKEFWRQISEEWTKRLAELEKTLPQIRVKELHQDYPDIIASINDTPGDLRALWKIYGEIVEEGTGDEAIPGHGSDGVDQRLQTAEMRCWARIYPLMEILGFNRDVFNRQMNRTAEVAESAEPTKLLSGTMEDYVLGQVNKLASEDEVERNQALQVIMGMKDVSLRVLKQKLETGVEAGSRMEGLLLICLGRLGEASVANRLIRLAQTSAEESTRVSATLAAGSTKSADALSPLVVLLRDDKSAAVRAAAASALSFLGHPSALDGVIDAFMDPDLAVRQSARTAAIALSKHDFQYDPKAPERTRKAQTDDARAWLEQNRSKLEPGGK